ncbi:monovalent cation/H+ antiporter complex subunit F [Tomitella fengzijianii]|uniref:Cation:proton antiporter n=1 Tax=Tomitella fengzijianii TaxID=2597660 RepID=A0A516X5P8_9ACTN|nr:monovalent cation/H+ antiporter complex subunit F [Tomitella fengzijianii]QDQ98360.1 cation:proton antiporter [Tomitella fengzijianii]
MNVVWILAGCALVAAALLAVYRLIAGPSTLDRLVATEMAASVCMSGMGAWAAYSVDSSVLAALVALALLGFIGSISVPRFRRRDRE